MSDKTLPIGRFRKTWRSARQPSTLEPSRLLPEWMPRVPAGPIGEGEFVELVFEGIEAAWAHRSRAIRTDLVGLTDGELLWAMEILAHPAATKAVRDEMAILMVMATAH